MFDADESIQEYMEHYECPKERAIVMILEDMELARKELIEQSIKIKEARNG